MSTMYSRSVVMLEQAKAALAKVSEDDAYLDAALQSSTACHSALQLLQCSLKLVQPLNILPRQTRQPRCFHIVLQVSKFDFSSRVDKQENYTMNLKTKSQLFSGRRLEECYNSSIVWIS